MLMRVALALLLAVYLSGCKSATFKGTKISEMDCRLADGTKVACVFWE